MKNSTIRCRLCGHEQAVNLNDFINTTTRRCTNCQTGSFGEYVIATTLLYNGISFDRELRVDIDDKHYRLDFLIQHRLALEYSGMQHFKQGLYYNEAINDGVQKKREWAKSNGYAFIELIATYDIDNIIDDLSKALDLHLQKPTLDFFKQHNPDAATVLDYMRTHSMRQTMKDLSVPSSKIKTYVRLSGYTSVSAWQAENKTDI